LKIFAILLLLSCGAIAQENKTTATFESSYAATDVALSTQPDSDFWRSAPSIQMDASIDGRAQPEFRTEVRSRWTDRYIYFLFICPYQQLYLRPKPDSSHETNQLWNWNVAEVFLGSDFTDIQRYKEFEVSPQNEWIDLDVNLHNPHHEEGWVWNSGFQHAARVDAGKHVWVAALRIPFAALDKSRPKAGKTFRSNFYRTEGSTDHPKEILWQPTMKETFHVPERFGLLKLVAK
jgi:hypothetical protein